MTLPETSAISGSEDEATMSLDAILQRILATVDDQAYLTPTSQVPSQFREALQAVQQALLEADTQPDQVRQMVHRFFDQGKLDKVHMLSALHVIEASPRVRNYVEAARLVAEQELAALQAGGPMLNDSLASVERHRGVLVFLQGHFDVALEYFTRALERQRSPENMGNILCALIRLGEEQEAQALLEQMRNGFPDPFIRALHQRIEKDPDLAHLKTEVD